MTNLGTLGGDYTYPAALNNLGQIVGESAIPDGSPHAFLWQNGTMVDLNTLLPPDSGWILTSGQFINDAGRIVGYGTYNGVEQWFALDPGSENGPPVAAAGPDQNVTCQTEVTFDGSGSSDPDGDALSYQWSYAGNVFSTNAVAVALFDLGKYPITLTVTDPCGQSSQDEVIVQVTDPVAPTLSAPPAVTIPTGANCQGAVPNIVPSVVAADNCTAASALVVTQNPLAGTLLSAGQHTLTVSVADASGNRTTESVTLNVVDTIPPVIVSCPSTLTVSAGEHCQGIVPNLGSYLVATDNCTPAAGLIITQTPAAGTLLDGGQHFVTVTVTDAAGNATSTSVSLTVADTSAPAIVSLAASPDVLSPPNNQLVPITVTVLASDNCDGAPVSRIVSITADEPVAAGDIQITGNLTARLVASKSSPGSQRIYTLTVRCTDASGNYSTGTMIVRVPKSQSGPDIGGTKPVL
jgi:probable HAF family extracellular repeat protein